MEIVRPRPEYLPGYVDALQRGWSPDNVRGAVAAQEVLARIAADAAAFLALTDDPEARGPVVTLPDGSQRARIPGLARAQGLAQVKITTDPDNGASQRVITANGGVLVESFDKGLAYGHQPGLRYRIELA